MNTSEPTISQAVAMVDKFNREIVGRGVTPLDPTRTCGVLQEAAEKMADIAKELLDAFKAGGGAPVLRGHLVVEEAGELLEAMSTGDEVKTLDALADLTYVDFGTAAELDLPLGAAFVEVHRSNMTKQRKSTDPDGCRVRDKGEAYQPPNLEKVLEDYRMVPY